MFGKKKLIREYNDVFVSMLTAYEDLSYDFVRPDASGLDFSYRRLGERTQQLLSVKKFFEDISPNNASSYVSTKITELAHDLRKAAMEYSRLQTEKLGALQQENAELQAYQKSFLRSPKV